MSLLQISSVLNFNGASYNLNVFEILELITDHKNYLVSANSDPGRATVSTCMTGVADKLFATMTNDSFVESKVIVNKEMIYIRCATLIIDSCSFVDNLVSVNNSEAYHITARFAHVTIQSSNFIYGQILSGYKLPRILYMADNDDTRLMIDNVNISHFYEEINDVLSNDEIHALIYLEAPNVVNINSVRCYNNSIPFLQTLETDITDFEQKKFYIHLTNSIFESSTVNKHYMIALYSHGYMEVTFTNVIFIDCIIVDTADNSSNLVYIYQDSDALVRLNHIYIDNCLTIGSMLHLDCDVDINNSTFSNNMLNYGIIASFDDSNRYTWNIKDSQFINNQASEIAGAIYSFQNSISILNCLFDSNKAAKMSGDIATFGDSLSVITCTISNSRSDGSAGSIWIGSGYADDSGLNTKFIDNIFSNASCNDYGGAILHQTSNINNIMIVNNTFHNCTGTYGNVLNLVNENILDDDDFVFENNHIIDSFGNNNSDISNNPYDTVSFPIKLLINNESIYYDDICPNCVKSIELTAIDIFNQQWIPYTVCNEYIFNSDDRCKSIEILHSISVSDDTTDSYNEIVFEINSQSSKFTQGFGSETFVLYPLPVNNSIDINIYASIQSIETATMKMNVTKCDAHYFATNYNSQKDTFTCVECEYGAYNLGNSDSTTTNKLNEECLQCPENMICNGGDDIYIFENYYVSQFDDKLYTYQCPSGSCCQDRICKVYFENFESDTIAVIDFNSSDDNFCSSNRDFNSRLCSQCDDGMSVVKGSEICHECDNSSIFDDYKIWLIGILLICFYGNTTLRWGEKSHRLTDSAKIISIRSLYFFRICSFFYQVTPFILLQHNTNSNSYNNENIDASSSGYAGTINTVNTNVEAYFNSDISNYNQFYICIFDGLKNWQRLFLQYTIPIMCILLTIIFAILNFCLKKLRLSKWTYYHSTAMVRCVTFVYAQIIRTSFELVSCRDYNNGEISVMYYDGNIKCFESWHIIPFILIIISVSIPIIIVCKLYKSHVKHGPLTWFEILRLPYKEKYYWFEAYRMSRLFCISLLMALNIDDLNRLIWIRVLLIYYIAIHLYFSPFNSKHYEKVLYFDVNHLETLNLHLLFLLTMLADFYGKNEQSQYTIELIFNSVVLIPFVIFILVCIRHHYYMKEIIYQKLRAAELYQRKK